MSCKKCKLFLKEGAREEYFVHNYETHGFSLDILRANNSLRQYLVEQYIQKHKETGKQGKFKAKL